MQNNNIMGAREMAQHLRSTHLLLQRTHIQLPTVPLELQFQELCCPLCVLRTETHIDKTLTNMQFFFNSKKIIGLKK